MTNELQSELPESNWWEPFYDDWAQLVLADQSDAEVSKDVSKMEYVLQFAANASVLDQCCGLGQHARELCRRGYRVVGIDQSSAYIAHAKRVATEKGMSVSFYTADAMAYVETEGVDAVVNWHSSFGYHNEDDHNLAMLKCGWKSLRPGGRMLLEFPNMIHLIKNFEATMKRELPGGITLTRRSWIDVQAGTLRQRWSYRRPPCSVSPNGLRQEHGSLLRVYLPSQLMRFMERAGFVDVRTRSHSGEKLSIDDARCIVVGRRPEP